MLSPAASRSARGKNWARPRDASARSWPSPDMMGTWTARVQVLRALGAGLVVEENAQLFQEDEALADILGDVSASNGEVLARMRICSNPQRIMVSST